MSETVQVAIIVALTGVVGPALMGEIRDWLQRRRRRAAKRRRRQVKALDQTFAMLSALVDATQHLAVGDIVAKDAAMADVRAQRNGSIWLVGRADVIREYQDLLGVTQRRLGQTIRAEDAIEALQVLGRVSDALGAQKERARRGNKLLEVSPADRKELGDAAGLAAKMIPIDRYPSIPARVARRAVLILNRIKGPESAGRSGLGRAGNSTWMWALDVAPLGASATFSGLDRRRPVRRPSAWNVERAGPGTGRHIRGAGTNLWMPGNSQTSTSVAGSSQGQLARYSGRSHQAIIWRPARLRVRGRSVRLFSPAASRQ